MSKSDESEKVFDTSDEDVFRYEYGPDESPSQAVVTAMADAVGRAVTPSTAAKGDGLVKTLPPLYETVDPDALDALFATDDDGRADCSVTFTYCGHTVTVRERVVKATPAP